MINPDLLTSAEKLQYDGYLRREETNGVIMKLTAEGISIKEIVRAPYRVQPETRPAGYPRRAD